MKFESQTFENHDLILDGNNFYDCLFIDCTFKRDRSIGFIAIDNCYLVGCSSIKLYQEDKGYITNCFLAEIKE